MTPSYVSIPCRTGNASASPAQPVEKGPPLSRVSSGDSWLEVTRDCSSDDLTDLEDTNLVSVAPRPEPRVRSIRVTSLRSSSTGPAIGGLRLEDSDAAPAGSRSPGSIDAPEPSSMYRPCDAQEPVGMRMRTAATKPSRPDKCTEASGTASPSGSPNQGEGTVQTEGALSMSRVAAVCGVSPDSDLIWTFLAGCASGENSNSRPPVR